MNTRKALGDLLDSLPPDFPNRAYYDEICAREQKMKYDDETPPHAFRENMTAVHAKLAGAASVRGLQHISDTAANALRKAITQMEHVRVFASSGHKIHPTGLDLFDADLGYIKRSLVAIEEYRAERGEFVPAAPPRSVSRDHQMDSNARYILNDLTDVVEELAKVMREVNPGANWAFMDFLLARVSRQLEEALQAAGPQS